MLLGTVPVEADGSAYFRAPARKPLYFQAVDAEGRAIQSMRSVDVPSARRAARLRGLPRADRRRHRCRIGRSPWRGRPPRSSPGRTARGHSRIRGSSSRSSIGTASSATTGRRGRRKSTLVLTGDPDGLFTKSYASLKPYLAWFEWGGASISGTVTEPGRIGADVSRLTKVLADATHAAKVRLPGDDRERLMVWLDGNAPFYGTYGNDEQRRQRAGEAVPPPGVQ